MMSDEPMLPLPDACRAALTAIEAAPLDLPGEVLTHLEGCAACAEARVHWLAQEEAPAALAPAGYFQQLPGRVLRKLPPARTQAPLKRPFLWAAAALLLASAGLGGFLAGQANRTPLVEAEKSHTPAELHEVEDAPFHERDEVLAEVERLSPEQLQALLDKLNANQAR